MFLCVSGPVDLSMNGYGISITETFVAWEI